VILAHPLKLTPLIVRAVCSVEAVDAFQVSGQINEVALAFQAISRT